MNLDEKSNTHGLLEQNDKCKTLVSHLDINQGVRNVKTKTKKKINDDSKSEKQPKTKYLEKSCIDCGKKVQNLKKHYDVVHDNKSKKCLHCNKEFKNEYLMNSHVENVHEKIPCSDCGRQIGLKQMSRHMKAHEKRFLCNLCGKSFGTKQILSDHTNIHNGKKPYICKFCPDSFASFGTMRMHERSHEGHRRKNSKKLCNTKKD